MKVKLKKPSSVLFFILVILVSGAAGAIISITLSRFEGTLQAMLGQLAVFLAANIITIQIMLSSLLSAAVLFLHYSAKKSIHSITDEDSTALEGAELKVSVAMGFTVASNISVFLFMFLLTYFASIDINSVANIGFGMVLAVIFLFINVFFDVASVKLIKRINPQKKGDPLKFSFEKEYMESCDEAEKYNAYIACYKSFTVLKIAFIVIMAVLMLLQTIVNVGPAAPIAVAFLWALHSITYTVASIRSPK